MLIVVGSPFEFLHWTPISSTEAVGIWEPKGSKRIMESLNRGSSKAKCGVVMLGLREGLVCVVIRTTELLKEIQNICQWRNLTILNVD